MKNLGFHPIGCFARKPLTLLDCGGQGRNRTADASLFRAALYRLSYLAISGELHTCIFGRTAEDCVRTERFRL
jgi:hypothetical protein